jgi:hypothetical protein
MLGSPKQNFLFLALTEPDTTDGDDARSGHRKPVSIAPRELIAEQSNTETASDC